MYAIVYVAEHKYFNAKLNTIPKTAHTGCLLRYDLEEESEMSRSVETNFDKIYKELEKMQKAPKKVIDRTIKDFKQRAPSWVAQEVVKEYNIKKNEITPAGGRKKLKAGETKVHTRGKTLATTALVYEGRLLTPVHFSMSPKAPKQSYTLKAQVLKGERKTLGKTKKLTKKQRKNIGRNFTHQSTRTSHESPIMLMPTGNKQEGGTDYIPFQRKGYRDERPKLHVIKTISMPQMVQNPKVDEGIYKAINEELGKRFNHYVDLYFKK